MTRTDSKEKEGGATPAGVREAARPRSVSEELGKMRAAVQALCPPDAAVAFHYDGKLRINIDIRALEDLARLETLLPTACDGAFLHIQRGQVDHHPFLHRLTALVDR